ncbi:hypothetical protein LTR91_008208 [Friedmanniomyces endolithicus]|uniref:Formate/nitrite transporter n=1 Tax=Friedmanniomyces endolithicus TaxID=329885 RepID=A0AAN6QUR8_9PEZI|nr:hypothetical protein LTR94_010147 [Friedmanniomyces endolithicus]KAK0789126.1 hypothetical protein LTR59_009765 [Friedmanniomyces endolithicus]KAK0799059.1 hypothetical protein LTR38_007633 [Friedmanniomyces endolithicus]KAK0801751.1 hypothetical protein LTR75_008480 [Friedmanniomyces endolithicus]KAK0842485.1 hypothetical protein LTR03_009234 [Friedmanniomyces endolithicus]
MAEPHGTPPRELARLLTQAGLAKARLGYPEYIVKSFLGGVFISLGALTDLVIISGSPGLRASNPSLATMIAAFTFPVGFVLIILTNVELCTSNMFVMPFTLLQRKTTVWDLVKNWIITYFGNLAGCLFVAGFLAWWTDTLNTDTQTAYAVTQAEGRVNVQWSVNFLRGIGCNLFVALSMYLALGSNDYVSKIYSIWIPIWVFVILGYQHSIANFFQVPIGMFYGTNFGVGKYIYQSVIPVTLGNIVGAGLLAAIAFWYLYGRDVGSGLATGQDLPAVKPAMVGIKDAERLPPASGASYGDDSLQLGSYGRVNMEHTV